MVKHKCWEWTGSLKQSGYGFLIIKGKCVRAHRFSYYLRNPHAARESFICHSCDNPKCVNPDHLFAGSPQDNVNDMIGKNRKRNRNGKCKRGSSNYHGVSFRKESNRWRARYTHQGKLILIGQYKTALEAAYAYDEFIKSFNQKCNPKDIKKLNFPSI